jgi:hypothetical protein
MDSANMVEIPAGRFRMGCADFYPEERPVREVQVEAFAIGRGPVTVAQFRRFTEDTGYMTLAERRPDPADHPDTDPSLLVPGSAVFHPTPGPVPLHDPARWWTYVPGANWRHPWGPDNSGREDHPVTHVAYEDAEAYATWAGRRVSDRADSRDARVAPQTRPSTRMQGPSPDGCGPSSSPEPRMLGSSTASPEYLFGISWKLRSRKHQTVTPASRSALRQNMWIRRAIPNSALLVVE